MVNLYQFNLSSKTGPGNEKTNPALLKREKRELLA